MDTSETDAADWREPYNVTPSSLENSAMGRFTTTVYTNPLSQITCGHCMQIQQTDTTNCCNTVFIWAVSGFSPKLNVTAFLRQFTVIWVLLLNWWCASTLHHHHQQQCKWQRFPYRDLEGWGAISSLNRKKSHQHIGYWEYQMPYWTLNTGLNGMKF